MNFKDYIEEFPLFKSAPMQMIKDVEISENLKYHIENELSLCENAFRIYSDSYFNLINEVRELYNKDLIAVNDEDAELLETDIGTVVEHNGSKIYLDIPFIEREERIDERTAAPKKKKKKGPLNKPMRTPGGPKKFKVYVKVPNTDRIKTVRFGDSKSSGLSIKNSDPARAKSFRARHKCSEKKDKTKAGYWSCNIGRYAKSVGLKSNKPW